jgi:DNA mismatch repair protein MutL
LPAVGHAASGEASQVQEPAPSPFRRGTRFLVVHDLYVLCETGDGFAVVDQHALHERVIYEKLLAAYRTGSVPVQRLLLPAVVELPLPDKELLVERAATLARSGLLVSDFGGNAVKVEGVPAILRRVDIPGLLLGLVDDLRAEGPVREPDEVCERFHRRACRSAVMAGDRLRDEEIADLLAAAAALEHPHNCPHGRPTVLSYPLAQLERYFRRRP